MTIKPYIIIAVFVLLSRSAKAANNSIDMSDSSLSFLGRNDLPRGIRNNNPGNIDQNAANNWQGRVPLSENTDSRFEQFQTYYWGIRAMIKLIIGYVNRDGLNTIRKIINKYAPSVENNVEAYVQFIVNNTGIPADQPLQGNAAELRDIIIAMAKHENGVDAISKTQYLMATTLL